MQRAWNKSTGIVISFFLITSCSNIFIDVIKTGPDFPPTKKVDIFTTRQQIKSPYAAIAILHSQRFNCSQKMQDKILKKAVALAKKNGGDAIVYYFDYGENDLYIPLSEKCYFSGAVFKYLTTDVLEKYGSEK